MNKISQTKILRELMTWIVQNLRGVTCMIGVRTISGTLSSKSSILIYHYFPLILKITLLLIVFSLLRLFIVSQGPLSSKLSSVVCLMKFTNLGHRGRCCHVAIYPNQIPLFL